MSIKNKVVDINNKLYAPDKRIANAVTEKMTVIIENILKSLVSILFLS